MRENGKESRKQVVLLMVLGTSPAVLTETVWALAMRKEAVIPDEIVVITTLKGKACLQGVLEGGESSVWGTLCAALKKKGKKVDGRLHFGAQNSIQVFSQGSRDLEDISTGEENTCAANFLLRVIRGYSENPRTQIYASIAGGRKTMSALMLSCMSLLGRDDDHVLHVLVHEPFDQVTPPFYFPDSRIYVDRNGREWSSRQAKIELIDLPFVKVRGLYEEKFQGRVPSYAELVQDTQRLAPEARVKETPPLLEFDIGSGTVLVDGREWRLSPVEFMMLVVLFEIRPTSRDVLNQKLVEYHHQCHEAQKKSILHEWLEKFGEGSKFCDAGQAGVDSTKVLSTLRKKMERQEKLSAFSDEIAPKGRIRVTYPETRISLDIQILKELFHA